MARGSRYSQESRMAAAKAGLALPDGSYPIRNRRELMAAVRRRRQGSAPYPQIVAHIRKRAKELGVKLNMTASGEFEIDDSKVIVVSFDPEVLTAAGPPAGRYGRSTSLKWPWLYDILRSKGYDKSKAAAISNSRLRFRKKGRINVLQAKQAHSPAVLKRVAQAQKAGKHMTGKQLTK